MTTLYRNGRVFDGERMIDGHAVLVDGERIARVAPEPVFEGFGGEEVDCSDCTLMPGLIDCHVHLLFRGEPDPMAVLDKLDAAHAVVRALEHAADTLRGGITSVRDCGGREYQEFAVRNACNDGRFPGPTIRAAGKMICMTGGHGNRMGRVADGSDEVVKAVREQVHAGCDLVKIMATGGVMTPGVNPEDAHYSAEEMAVGIAEAKRFPPADGQPRPGRGGHSQCHPGRRDLHRARHLHERGVLLGDGGTGNVSRAHPGGPAPHPGKCRDRHTGLRGREGGPLRTGARAVGAHVPRGGRTHRPWNGCGDAVQPARSELRRTRRFMVEVGMTSLEALQAGTSNAADLMGLDDRGRIVEGAAADLLLVDGDPSRDISAAADRGRHRRVVRNGEVVPGRSRQG